MTEVQEWPAWKYRDVEEGGQFEGGKVEGKVFESADDVPKGEGWRDTPKRKPGRPKKEE